MANSVLPPALPDLGPLITAWQTLKNLQVWVAAKADFRMRPLIRVFPQPA
jgi:hypothetical protein